MRTGERRRWKEREGLLLDAAALACKHADGEVGSDNDQSESDAKARASIHTEENRAGALLELVGRLLPPQRKRRGQQALGARRLRHVLGREAKRALCRRRREEVREGERR